MTKLTPNEIIKLKHLGVHFGLLPASAKPVELVPRSVNTSLRRKGLILIRPGRTLNEWHSELTPAGRAEIARLAQED